MAVGSYLEKESHDEHLQTRHAHHQQALDDAEVKYAPLGAPHRAEVPVLPCPEVLLVTRDG